MNTSLKLPCLPEECDAFLSRPTAGAIQTVKQLDGDILIAGAGGKMGPTLAMMAAQAQEASGRKRKVFGVSRFSSPESRELLEKNGIETIPCDLMNEKEVAKLPDVENIIFMAGQKFGTSSGPELTWAMNTLVPANVAKRYPTSRHVAFSTGCVYSFAKTSSGGSREGSETNPPGDYANSCLGREQIYSYFAKTTGTPVCLFRLNYAIDFRYGVLLDIAVKVHAGEPVDVSMGHVNLIWQGDANARAIQSLALADSPARPLNVTGPETVSVRELALRFSKLFDKEAQITGQEADHAWLSNAGESIRHFGYPEVALDSMIEWVAAWVLSGGKTLGKPTHFETRDGKF
ncbi:MAG: NAD-dependent epimerase/dehydratase family protein [Chthoniobacterales bacterium]